MARRPSGAGGLRKRGDAWQSTARDPRTGRQQWRTWPKSMTERQVGRAHAAWVAEVVGGRAADRSATVAGFLDRWLAVAGPAMTPTTRGKHAWAVRRLNAEIGAMRLADLSTLDVLELLERLSAELAPATLRALRGTLGKACRAAVAWRLLPVNPVSAAEMRRVQQEERATPTTKQVQALVTGEQDPMWRCYWAVLAHTGARPGEALTLRWADVDIDARVITVARTLTANERGTLVVGNTTKTRRARRVAMGDDLAAELRSWRQHCATVGLDLVRPAAPLFPGRGATGIVSVTSMQRAWAKARDRSGMDQEVTPHAVRHWVASTLMAQGVAPQLIATTLGHSIAEVQRRYGVHAPVDAALSVVQLLPSLRATEGA